MILPQLHSSWVCVSKIASLTEPIAKSFQTKKRERLLAITHLECGQCFQGYYCLHPSCIAGRGDESDKDSKNHNSWKLIAWGQWQARWTRGPQPLGVISTKSMRMKGLLVGLTMSRKEMSLRVLFMADAGLPTNLCLWPSKTKYKRSLSDLCSVRWWHRN